ncbi:MAG: hypothetical protein JW953_19595 [Anaerolineae bacterium]|nr:hypothetical protein [Anaerolineae bacterium]
MTQEPLIWGMALLLIFAGLLFYFTGRLTAGRSPALRRIHAFEALKGFTGRAIEAGRALHLSVGVGSVANQSTADSLAGLTVLDYLAEQGATTGVPPIVSMADPTVMLFAQNALRAAHADDPEVAEEAYRQIRWIAPQPAAYAAGVMSLMNIDETEANVLVGKFGDEYLLMGETAARRGSGHIGGTSDPNTLPFIYASAEETLLGEEIYAAGAYLQQRPFHISSLVAQDTMRWLILLFILTGILAASKVWPFYLLSEFWVK